MQALTCSARISCWLLGAGFFCAGPAQASISAAEARQLGDTLTLFGAEKAGNRGGTIPAYTGGLATADIPPDFKPGTGRWTDPFQKEKPLFSISSQNLAKYADQLSEASKALLRRDPTYRMDVYPSHRSVAYPAWVLDNIRKNALTARLTQDGLALEDAVGGIPFPVPKTGNEAMWNQLLIYNGYPSEYRARNWYVDSNGRATNTAEFRLSLQSKYYTQGWSAAELKTNGNAYIENALNFTAPLSVAANSTYFVDTLDPVTQPRRTWAYNASSRRVRSVPTLDYDMPMSALGGVAAYDELFLFQGRQDLFDFKLVGKREMYIPYHNYRLVFQATSAQILTPGHLNPDFVRWELHRVWVVEATRKPGKQHSLTRRVFYFDEDWSGAGMSDGYGRNDQLNKGMFMAATPLYDLPTPLARCYWAYDLLDNRYGLGQHLGDPGLGFYPMPEGFPPFTFTPDGLPNRPR